MGQGIFFGNVRAARADGDDQFGLVVKVVGPGRIGHRLPIIDHGIGRLGEEKGRVTVRILAHFARVCGIVPADAEDAPHREPLLGACNGDRGLR